MAGADRKMGVVVVAVVEERMQCIAVVWAEVAGFELRLNMGLPVNILRSCRRRNLAEALKEIRIVS